LENGAEKRHEASRETVKSYFGAFMHLFNIFQFISPGSFFGEHNLKLSSFCTLKSGVTLY